MPGFSRGVLDEAVAPAVGSHPDLSPVVEIEVEGEPPAVVAGTGFGGQTALQRMLAGDVTDLAAVRAYLDAERGGW